VRRHRRQRHLRPRPWCKGAALEAIDAGVKLLVLVPDRVPIYDVLEISRAAKRTAARFSARNPRCLSVAAAVLG